MLLDSLGERYGKLPSEVLAKATTFDVWVYDVAVSYRNYRNERDAKNRNQIPAEKSMPEYDPRELQRKFQEFHERKNRS